MKIHQQNYQGFTLIEVLIAIAILAILVSMAIPNFSQYLMSARRVDAQHVLLNNAQRLVRCFTLAGSYNGSCTLKTVSQDGYYSASAVLTELTYQLTATPTTNSTQSSDSECQTFTLDDAGATGAKNAADASAENCW